MARSTPVHAGYTILHGAGTGSNGKRIDVWAEYKLGTQSVAGNYTPITVYFYAALNPSYTSTTSKTSGLNSALKVDGRNGTGVSNGAYDFTSSAKVNLLGSYSGNIGHNTDGTKSLTIAGSFTTASTYISGGAVSGTITLPTIARETSVGATAANIGQTSVIAMSVKSSEFTHSLGYAFGSLRGYITADGQTSAQEVRFTAASIPFTVPEDFYAQIPNAPSGICTLTCRTYSGDTQIGDAQTATFTVTALEAVCKPLVSGTVEDVNPVTLALTGDAKRLIRYASTARCTLTAQARNSASIVKSTIGGVAVTGDSVELENIEQGNILFAVTDSRGYGAEASDPAVVMVDYSPVTNLASVSRDDPTSGNVTVNLAGSYWSGSFGAAENSLQLQYRINGGEWVTAQPELTVEKGKYAAVLPLTGLDYTQSHTVQIRVVDLLVEAVKTLQVQKGIPVFDWGEEDFVFHVPVSMPQLVSPTLDAILARLEALEKGS